MMNGVNLGMRWNEINVGDLENDVSETVISFSSKRKAPLSNSKSNTG